MKKTVSIQTDPITDEISRLFDYTFDGTTSFSVPRIDGIPQEFGIGLIVGPSGSGKSSLLSQMGTENSPSWNANKAICSHFASAQEASERLAAVGLNSIPSWMKPFHVLSTGEQFRADLARRLVSGARIDEFTSTVDRGVARSCSYAIRRHVDKHALRNLVFATCHYDVIEWLQPDWVFDTAESRLVCGRSERRPQIKLEILPCSSKAWSRFSHHHYLSGYLNPSARCWIASWDGEAIGFVSAVAFPNGAIKNAWREHRTVILPDYQGLGLGVRLSNAIAQIMVAQGNRYFSKTAHPRLGEYRQNSPLWRPTSKNQRSRLDYREQHKSKEDGHKMLHAARTCYSHEYVGKQTMAE